MIGNKYILIGTDTIFEITGETNAYWELKIYAESNPSAAQSDVLMTKMSLSESITQKTITLI